MRKILIRILGLVVVIGTIWFGVAHRDMGSLSGTAFAIGDLVIDWGVPVPGDPIFTVNNFAPGEMEVRSVQVTNNHALSRELGVVGVEKNEVGALGDVLELVISEGGTDLYGGSSAGGPKTLMDFFADSSGDEIPLTTLASGETATLTFKVTFLPSAGNEFQNASVTFDITLGLTETIIGLPAECDGFDFSNANVVVGTNSSNLLFGTGGRDVIFGLGGGDLITGGGGDDCIVGGPGGDLVRGGSGNDIVFGNEAGDSLLGGDGNDQIFGGLGGDSLVGGAGSDQLFGQEDSDSLSGEGGSDVAYGGSGSDSLAGGGGNDQLFGEAGQDAASGGSGTDTCEAEAKTSCEA